MTNERWLARPPLALSLNASLDKHFCLIAALSALLLFLPLQRGDLAGYDDAVYAHEGKQMLRSGDWWNVQLNGRPDFDKPPLFIWLEAASFRLFGVNDFAAKFPAALAGWGAVVLVYQLAFALFGQRTLAALAMFVMATTPYFLKYAMHAMTDVPFAFLVTLALFCYWKGRQSAVWLLGSGLATGLAMLTRSHLGLLPLAIAIAHLLVTRRYASLRSTCFIASLALAVALPLAWFVPQTLTHGARFWTLHLAYTAENATWSQPRANGFWFGLLEYPWLLLKHNWLWLAAIVTGATITVRSAFRVRDEAAQLLLLWIAIIVVPFSLIEHKVLRYLLPAFPAFSLLAALGLRQWFSPVWLERSLKLASPLLTAALLGVVCWPGHLLRARNVAPLAKLATEQTAVEQRIQFYAAGAPRWDYVHQVIWYGERECELLTGALPPPACWQGVLIADQASFAGMPAHFRQEIELLGATAGFVCLRRAPFTVARATPPGKE